MPFPWAVILKQAPMLISAAETLLASSRRSAAAASATDAQAVRQRLADIEAHQEANAEVVRQLTEQVSALAQAAEAGARRVRLAFVVATAGVALALVACLIALLG
jgi:hypothetical protein